MLSRGVSNTRIVVKMLGNQNEGNAGNSKQKDLLKESFRESVGILSVVI